MTGARSGNARAEGLERRTATGGPVPAESSTVAAEFHRISNRFASIDAVLHRAGPKPSRAVVLFTHPRSQTNLTAWPLPQLAGTGIDGLCFNNRYTNSPAGTELDTIFEDLALDVAAAVEHARSLGYVRVLLMGHSAGGPTMAFYQRMAEAGNASLEPARTLSGFSGFRDDGGGDLRLPPADGLILRSITIGTAASFLVRLDASVVDEVSGERDPALDMYAPANGFDAARGTGSYDEDFLRRYRRAQADRMNRLIDAAHASVVAAEAGESRFLDDDFVVVPRTRANPATVDLQLGRQTAGEYELAPHDGKRVIDDVRAVNLELGENLRAEGAAVHRVSALLTYRLVRVDRERFNPLATTPEASGIDFASTNNSTPPNLVHVTAPLLVIQGSGDNSNSVKLPTAELIYNSARSDDRTLLFVEGGDHFMRKARPSFPDPRPTAVDRISHWVKERFAGF